MTISDFDPVDLPPYSPEPPLHPWDESNIEAMFRKAFLNFDPEEPRDDKGKWTAGPVKEAEKLAEVADTLAMHTRPDGTLDPERARLHDEIINDMLSGKRSSRNPVATFFGGGPASGKSTALHSPEESAVIESDYAKTRLPEYQAGIAAEDKSAAAKVHEESSVIAAKAVAMAQDKNISFTLDGTGDSSFEKLSAKVNNARYSGFQVHGRYVTVDTATAVERSASRQAKTGRGVPASVIRETHAGVSGVFPKIIANGLFDSLELWDNNGPSPVLIVSGHGTDIAILDQAAYDRFLGKARGQS